MTITDPASHSDRPDCKPPHTTLRTLYKSITRLATIYVGPSRSQWHIPTVLLESSSTFFHAALHSPFTESLTLSISLPEDRADIFEYFVYWLYTRRLDHPAVDAIEPAKPAYFWLLHLYCMADKFGAQGCKNDILDKIAVLADQTNSVPTPMDTWIVYDVFEIEELREEGIRRLLVDLFAWKRTEELIDEHEDEWHPRFMRDLCVRLKGKAFGMRVDKPWLQKEGMCGYHEHADGRSCVEY